MKLTLPVPYLGFGMVVCKDRAVLHTHICVLNHVFRLNFYNKAKKGRSLTDWQADLNYYDALPYDWTPLNLLVERKFLISKILNSCQRSALHFSFLYGNVLIFRLLPQGYPFQLLGDLFFLKCFRWSQGVGYGSDGAWRGGGGSWRSFIINSKDNGKIIPFQTPFKNL